MSKIEFEFYDGSSLIVRDVDPTEEWQLVEVYERRVGDIVSAWRDDEPWFGLCTGYARRCAMRRRLVTLEDAVRAVVDRHGGVRAAERATGIDKSFISRLMNGHKTAPSAETLQALGLRAVPLYEVLK